MSLTVIEAGQYKNITSSTQISVNPGRLIGFFVDTASSTPTIKIWDNPAASGNVIVNTFTPVAGTFYPAPANYLAGLFVTTSGTVGVTIYWDVAG